MADFRTPKDGAEVPRQVNTSSHNSANDTKLISDKLDDSKNTKDDGPVGDNRNSEGIGLAEACREGDTGFDNNNADKQHCGYGESEAKISLHEKEKEDIDAESHVKEMLDDLVDRDESLDVVPSPLVSPLKKHTDAHRDVYPIQTAVTIQHFGSSSHPSDVLFNISSTDAKIVNEATVMNERPDAASEEIRNALLANKPAVRSSPHVEEMHKKRGIPTANATPHKQVTRRGHGSCVPKMMLTIMLENCLENPTNRLDEPVGSPPRPTNRMNEPAINPRCESPHNSKSSSDNNDENISKNNNEPVIINAEGDYKQPVVGAAGAAKKDHGLLADNKVEKLSEVAAKLLQKMDLNGKPDGVDTTGNLESLKRTAGNEDSMDDGPADIPPTSVKAQLNLTAVENQARRVMIKEPKMEIRSAVSEMGGKRPRDPARQRDQFVTQSAYEMVTGGTDFTVDREEFLDMLDESENMLIRYREKSALLQKAKTAIGIDKDDVNSQGKCGVTQSETDVLTAESSEEDLGVEIRRRPALWRSSGHHNLMAIVDESADENAELASSSCRSVKETDSLGRNVYQWPSTPLDNLEYELAQKGDYIDDTYIEARLEDLDKKKQMVEAAVAASSPAARFGAGEKEIEATAGGKEVAEDLANTEEEYKKRSMDEGTANIAVPGSNTFQFYRQQDKVVVKANAKNVLNWEPLKSLGEGNADEIMRNVNEARHHRNPDRLSAESHEEKPHTGKKLRLKLPKLKDEDFKKDNDDTGPGTPV